MAEEELMAEAHFQVKILLKSIVPLPMLPVTLPKILLLQESPMKFWCRFHMLLV
jgi:hypothetical protein